MLLPTISDFILISWEVRKKWKTTAFAIHRLTDLKQRSRPLRKYIMVEVTDACKHGKYKEFGWKVKSTMPNVKVVAMQNSWPDKLIGLTIYIHTKGFWPEWYISTICSREIPFWLETLDMLNGLTNKSQPEDQQTTYKLACLHPVSENDSLVTASNKLICHFAGVIILLYIFHCLNIHRSRKIYLEMKTTG